MSKRWSVFHFAVTFMVILLLGFGGPVLAQEKEKPPRGMVASLRYPGLVVGPEDKIRVDLVVKNIGRSSEMVFLEVTEKPKGWKTQIKSMADMVSGIFVAEDEEKTLTFTAEPEVKEDKLPVGQYKFVVQAKTADGALVRTSALAVTVMEKEKTQEALKITTSYPVLRGPSDSKFEFSLDVNNDSDEDALFHLAATAPDGWEISFKPAYEQKQISSLRIKANQSQSVNVEVSPPREAEAGEFPINVKVNSAKAKTEVALKVLLTGTYKVKVGTLQGLLSLATQTGQEASMSVYVRNTGSAPQREISFLSFKPENWKVEFKPEKVANLKPGAIEQIEVKITPAQDALVGDYSVAINAQGEKAQENLELRITVKASSAWGWVGVAIIVLVIIGLAFAFRRLGRR